MKKQEIESAILKLYNTLEGVNTTPNLSPINVSKFIIFGGSAMVLQDRLEETSDVDILTDWGGVKQTFEYFMSKDRDETRIHCHKMFFDIIGFVPVLTGFNYLGNKFEMIDPMVSSHTLCTNGEEKEELKIGERKIFVRPSELILKDWQKYIDYTLKEYPGEYGEKVSKYQKRLKEIRGKI